MKYLPKANAFQGSDHDGLAQVMWHVTDVCPLACPYCFATKTGLATGAGDIRALAHALAELGVLKVDLGGGEPLTYRHLPDVVAHLTDVGMRMTVTTSGSGASALRQWLVSNLGCFTRVIISIDGTMALHDELRGRRGAFARARELARHIAADGYPGLRINTVVTSRLLSGGSLPALAHEISALGPVEWCLIQPHQANASVTFHEYSVSDDAFTEAVSLTSQVVEDTGASLTMLNRRSLDYAGYWVLYPDRSLRVHTESEDDYVAAQDLLGMNGHELRRVISKHGQKVPTVTVQHD